MRKTVSVPQTIIVVRRGDANSELRSNKLPLAGVLTDGGVMGARVVCLKGIRWDEPNLQANAEYAAANPKMKIDEPKTPYHYIGQPEPAGLYSPPEISLDVGSPRGIAVGSGSAGGASGGAPRGDEAGSCDPSSAD
ncbi:hypothetical protein EMIHUDRAFT_256248 [Emiliania huxleyi CCMP1516]|uniref:Uncharacterized protein n=2 Tax=Emiliania huxleyi TaxID=2903 RepID=A0A0D3IY25_EMIH1|nr:hypothetical protein EMIHUDRAFT_256248 [Emiliania huxleyi CCMP1516]EOD16160.1 hypothetical protein EMIHUDRAFT_256248 [Emiliania huxleyi CCMP1516]|eukprot:XP_005768589.1 hypothetical protein EMIHUDRAFT_256248 [Emiliania huxleyi CCMP1516]